MARHLSADAGGGSWYWYERYTRAGKAPSETDVYAMSIGDAGCVGCHNQAGHNRTGHDLVYTQVHPLNF